MGECLLICGAKSFVLGFMSNCAFCNTPLAVSYTGWQAARENAKKAGDKVVLSCLQCGAKRSENYSKGLTQLSEDQKKQIEDCLGRELTEEDMEYVTKRFQALARGGDGGERRRS